MNPVPLFPLKSPSNPPPPHPTPEAVSIHLALPLPWLPAALTSDPKSPSRGRRAFHLSSNTENPTSVVPGGLQKRPLVQPALFCVVTVNPGRRADIHSPGDLAERTSASLPLQICTRPMMMMRARARSLPAVKMSCTLVAHLTLEQFTHVSSTKHTATDHSQRISADKTASDIAVILREGKRF